MADTPATPAPQARAYHAPVPAYMQRLSMMGARFIEGNDGTGNAGTPGDQGGSGNDGSQQQAPPAPPAQQQSAGQGDPTPAAPSQQGEPQSPEQQGQGLENATPEQLRQVITDLRAENARDRTTARDNAAQEARNGLVQELGKALGLVEDGDNTPDADKLTQQLTEQTNAAKQSQLELAVYKAASNPDLGADAAALLDSRSFLETVAELDPTKTDDITSAIKEAVKDNPRLQNEQGQVPPKRSSNQMNQQNRTPVAETPADLAALIPRQF